MATLILDNLPDELYQSLHALATQHNQSLSEAAIDILTIALLQQTQSQTLGNLLADLRRDRENLQTPPQWLDSTTLLRQDRDR